MPETVAVRGGTCVKTDLFAMRPVAYPAAACAILDPPYGDGIVNQKWDKLTGRALAERLTELMSDLAGAIIPGGHVWLWGGIGTPGHRAFYRTLIAVEAAGDWECAEQITWKKKRAYGTDWRCLMTREECLRFVLGNAKNPRVYHKQFTEEKRGYAGFNAKHPAKNENKRLTAIWDHASDMTQNKPHECWKPPALSRSMIEATTNPGEMVLDLFAGSGEVSLVARELGRPFVAYENDPEQFDKLVARLGD